MQKYNFLNLFILTSIFRNFWKFFLIFHKNLAKAIESLKIIHNLVGWGGPPPAPAGGGPPSKLANFLKPYANNQFDKVFQNFHNFPRNFKFPKPFEIKIKEIFTIFWNIQ